MADKVRELEAEETPERPFDASDPKQVNTARKKHARKKVEERETLRTLMQYENGRRFIYDSIKCILDGNPVIPGDPHSTYFNLGQEYRARGIFQEVVKVAPKEFALMIEEMKIEK